jgi:hypothetical protein
MNRMNNIFFESKDKYILQHNFFFCFSKHVTYDYLMLKIKLITANEFVSNRLYKQL